MKSCAERPRKLNIFRTWISCRMMARSRGSRSLGSFGLAATLRMLVSICSGSLVLMFSLPSAVSHTVSRSPNAAMNRSFTPRTR